jgi:hypothetical protein
MCKAMGLAATLPADVVVMAAPPSICSNGAAMLIEPGDDRGGRRHDGLAAGVDAGAAAGRDRARRRDADIAAPAKRNLRRLGPDLRAVTLHAQRAAAGRDRAGAAGGSGERQDLALFQRQRPGSCSS